MGRGFVRRVQQCLPAAYPASKFLSNVWADEHMALQKSSVVKAGGIFPVEPHLQELFGLEYSSSMMFMFILSHGSFHCSLFKSGPLELQDQELRGR